MGQSNTKNKLEIDHQKSDELSIIRKFERTNSECEIILTPDNYKICFDGINHYKAENKTFYVTTIIGDNSFSGILDIVKNAIILVVDKNDNPSINQTKDCSISISKKYQSDKLNVVFLNMNNKSCSPKNTNNNIIQQILLDKIKFDLDNINPINGKQCKEIDILTLKPPPKTPISGGRANNKSKKKKSSKKHKKKKLVKKSLKKKKTSNKKIS
jgi:hypothetical protein